MNKLAPFCSHAQQSLHYYLWNHMYWKVSLGQNNAKYQKSIGSSSMFHLPPAALRSRR